MRTQCILVACLLLPSCGGSSAPDATPPADTPPPAETPGSADEAAPAGEAAAEAEGEEAEEPAAELEMPTAVELRTYTEHVHGFQPFTEARTALVGSFGEPHEEAEGWVYWYARDGDGCIRLGVQDMGGTVGAHAIEVAECPQP